MTVHSLSPEEARDRAIQQLICCLPSLFLHTSSPPPLPLPVRDYSQICRRTCDGHPASPTRDLSPYIIRRGRTTSSSHKPAPLSPDCLAGFGPLRPSLLHIDMLRLWACLSNSERIKPPCFYRRCFLLVTLPSSAAIPRGCRAFLSG